MLLAFPLRIEIVGPGDDLAAVVANAVKGMGIAAKSGDLVAVASKVVSSSEGRMISLKSLKPSKRARKLARRYDLMPEHAQLVMGQTDRVLGGVRGALLTETHGDWLPNAGVDLKNAPRSSAMMLPNDGFAAARQLRIRLRRLLREDLSVVIVDSRVTPLRLGTVGIAIGYSGFKGVRDFRGKPDLFGRRIRMTQHDLADDLAATAHLLMGEGRERIGAVLIRYGGLTPGKGSKSEIQLTRNRCLFAGVLT